MPVACVGALWRSTCAWPRSDQPSASCFCVHALLICEGLVVIRIDNSHRSSGLFERFGSVVSSGASAARAGDLKVQQTHRCVTEPPQLHALGSKCATTPTAQSKACAE